MTGPGATEGSSVDADLATRRHGADYIDRTIETVRNHREADNCWPQWANIFADEIEDLRAELSRLREQRDALAEALTAIRDCAKWYGDGERLAHEIHHALVVEVYSVADMALTREQRS